MKIVCKKENSAKKMLELVRHIVETEYAGYPILKEDLVLELSLQTKSGEVCPEHEDTVYLDMEHIQNISSSSSMLEYYYNNDALTKLYNRGKYEQDLALLEAEAADGFACIYIDAVGLHEINNHLGHSAGDRMLCSIADGIRHNFAHCPAYRIGGDEFVIFCFHQPPSDIELAISGLRKLLKQEGYEISVGMDTYQDGASLTDTIDRAELAMRKDKTLFYQQDGAKRQQRMLNHKLEKILLEKQDASQFLNVISSEYKGVYIVNPDKDTCRYIYIPEYFQEILKHNHNIFSPSLRMYCRMFVCEKDQVDFLTLLDHDYVLNRIRQSGQITYRYAKKDGSHINLQITIYDSSSTENNEMLWIFMDGDLK